MLLMWMKQFFVDQTTQINGGIIDQITHEKTID